MRRIYKLCWWIWPLLAVVILAAQSLYGRGVFGYFVIPLGMLIALGSSVFGSIGLWLAFKLNHGERRLWPFVSALVAMTPALTYIALLVRQW
jgi:hypothetical protein